jgi:cell wall-associated NlpC family hydrolase
MSLSTPITALLLLVACLAAHAEPAAERAPAPAADPVLQLLLDKGLLAAPARQAQQVAAQIEASPFIQQMRDRATELVMASMGFLGVRYMRGGDNAEEGFDCSGFTRYVFEHSLGLVLPRRADEQARQAGLLSVARNELKPGDLVFFNTMRRAFSHVGIYVGEGKFIHAPRAGAEVRIEDMRQSYWTTRFNGARRAETAAPQTLAPN